MIQNIGEKKTTYVIAAEQILALARLAVLKCLCYFE